MNVILGKRCFLFSKKRCEVTVIISNFTKLKVEQKVPVCTQMVENTSIICFLPFWKKANRVELPCILKSYSQKTSVHGAVVSLYYSNGYCVLHVLL